MADIIARTIKDTDNTAYFLNTLELNGTDLILKSSAKDDPSLRSVVSLDSLTNGSGIIKASYTDFITNRANQYSTFSSGIYTKVSDNWYYGLTFGCANLSAVYDGSLTILYGTAYTKTPIVMIYPVGHGRNSAGNIIPRLDIVNINPSSFTLKGNVSLLEELGTSVNWCAHGWVKAEGLVNLEP